MISQHFAVLGAALPLAGFGSYIWDMSRGRAEPNRVSWTLWAAAPLIAFAAEIVQGTSLQVALVTLALGVGPLAVLVASLASRGGYWKLTRFDIACGGTSAAALALWALTGRGDAAIALAIAADALAAAPTVRKSWSHPQSESPWTYLASGAGAGVTLLTVRHWAFVAGGFPAYVVAVCTLISATILLPRPAPAAAPGAGKALRGAGLVLGGAAGISGLVVPAIMIAGILSGPAPAVPPAPAPPFGSLQDHARPATAHRRPGVPRHRKRSHVTVSALLPGPGNHPAPPAPRPPSPGRSRPPVPSPTGTSPEPYPTTPGHVAGREPEPASVAGPNVHAVSLAEPEPFALAVPARERDTDPQPDHGRVSPAGPRRHCRRGTR